MNNVPFFLGLNLDFV